MAQKPKIGPDAFIVGFIFIFMLLLMALTSCKHKPEILPNLDLAGNGGNGGGNGGFDPGAMTCDSDSVYFDPQIQPLIRSYCATAECHNSTDRREDIILDNYNNIMFYGEVEAERPSESKLYRVLIQSTDENDHMPPMDRPQLTEDQINLIYRWIAQGARNNFCNGNCDTTDVRFSNFVQPFINNNCYGCHSGSRPGGGILLTNYQEVYAQVQNGKLMGSLRWDNGYFRMPKGATSRMSDCTINKMAVWVQNGAANN